MSVINESELSLGDGAYISQSPQVASKVYKNWFPNYPETTAISASQAFPTPGLTEMLETGTALINRGAKVMDKIPYFVNGTTLWQINRSVDQFNVETFTEVNLGNIEGTDRISIDTNGTQLLIVVPGTTTAYVFTIAGGLVQITDPAFIPTPKATIVNQVKFISGFFVFAADNGVVFHSNVNDGSSYNALNFFIYENARNDVVGIHEYKDQLYVFSTVSSAGYSATNISQIGSAFVAITGYTFPKGLSSQFSIFDFNGTFVMIGQGEDESPKIYKFTGNDFEAISHTSVELILQQYSDDEIANSFGFNYTRGGIYAVWSLPSNTFVYDAKASALSGKKIWHDRESTNLFDKKRWRVNSLVTAYGRLMVGDSEGGLIGFIDEKADKDYTEQIIREISLATIENNSKTVFHAYFEVILESGTSTDDEEPKIGMFYSSDARKEVPTRYKGCGFKGEYNRKQRWYNLGQTNRMRIYTLTTNKRLTLWKILVGLDG